MSENLRILEAENKRLQEEVKQLKREKVAIEKEHQLKEALLKEIPDMVSIQDQDLRILYRNWKGFAAVKPEKRRTGTPCYSTYRGYDQKCPDCHAVQVLQTHQPYR